MTCDTKTIKVTQSIKNQNHLRMKKFTLTAFAVLCALQSTNAQSKLPQPTKTYPSIERTETQMGKAPRLQLAPERQADAIYRPATEEIFYRNDDDSGWSDKVANSYTYTYDTAGRIASKVHKNAEPAEKKQTYEGYFYTYDEEGRVVQTLFMYSADGETWKKNTRYKYTWDDVVKNFQTSAEQATYDKITSDYTDIVADNCFRREVKRDEKGRVVSMTEYRYKQDGKNLNEYIYQRITPTYDETTGHASSVLKEDQVYDSATDSYSLGETYRFDNLVWLDCDDQYLYMSDSYRMGTRRALDFDFNYKGYCYGHYAMKYGEVAPEYTAHYQWTGDYGYDDYTCKVLDDNKSYEVYDHSWYDLNFDGSETSDEYSDSNYRYWFNERGIQVGEEQWGSNYGEEIQLYYAHKKEYVYDPTYDYQTEIIDYTFDMFNKVDENGNVNYKPSQRTVYSNFNVVGTTGLKFVGKDGNGVNYQFNNGNVTISGKGRTTFAVYDLQGRRVMSGSANGVATVNLNSLHGTYILQMTTDAGTKSIQIVK